MSDLPAERHPEVNAREERYFKLLTEVYEAMKRTVDEESAMPYYKDCRVNLDLFYRIERALER
jgi:hypothetical protein